MLRTPHNTCSEVNVCYNLNDTTIYFHMSNKIYFSQITFELHAKRAFIVIEHCIPHAQMQTLAKPMPIQGV